MLKNFNKNVYGGSNTPLISFSLNIIKQAVLGIVSGWSLAASEAFTLFGLGNLFFEQDIVLWLACGSIALGSAFFGGMIFKIANKNARLQNPTLHNPNIAMGRMAEEPHVNLAENPQQAQIINTNSQEYAKPAGGFFNNYFGVGQNFVSNNMTINMVNVSEPKSNDVNSLISKVEHLADSYNVMREDVPDFVKLHILYPNGNHRGIVMLYKNDSIVDYCDMSGGNTVIKRNFDLEDLKYYI